MKFNPIFPKSRILNNNILSTIKKVIKHGQFIMGPEVSKLENNLKNFTKAKYCLTVSSGTDALLISMMALNITKGDEVIVPSFSWISTASTIKLIGAKPVFVDVKFEDCNIDENLIEAKISNKTKAIICVSLFGNTPNIKKINKIAKKYKLPVIEDGAQSFGATYGKVYSCNLTTIGCTSFFPSKPLGSYGDAGAIFTNNRKLYLIMKSIRLHGKSENKLHDRLGINGRMDTIQCAIVLEKLKFFKNELKLRKKVFSKYYNFFSKNYLTKIKVINYGSFGQSAYAQLSLLSENRNNLIKTLKINSIPYAIYYPKPMDQQKIFRVNKKEFTKNSHQISKQIISLPFGPYLNKKDLNKIFSVLRNYLKK
jgi:UDP-2-acetamido-2-deoxy-ribo-hexuluronate aminotransferase